MAAACTSILAGLLGIAHARAAALPASDLEQCVARALHPTGATGIQPGLARTTFLLTGDSQVFSKRLARDGCVGFLAAGARQVQSLELVLQAANGRPLGRSVRPTTLAYALHCGKTGERVFATVRMLDGQGEVTFVPLSGAGPHPAALDALQQCHALGTPRPAPFDVGPEPPSPSIEAQVDAAHAELSELGYDAERVVAYGTVHAGQHDASGLLLEPQRCYALVGVGSSGILDLDMRVFGPTLPLMAAAADVTRRRSALVKFCAEPPGRYVLDVTSFQGSGAYAVTALELTEPATPPGIRGQARIAYAETLARMRARGMQAHALTTGIVRADDLLAIPLTLRAGACHAIAAIDVAEREAVPLQLGLTDERGDLLALDARGLEPPLVYHCTQQAEAVSAQVRSNQAHGEARFVLVVGSDGSDPEVAP